MLRLIRRCPEFVSGYRDYCRELYDHHVLWFRPTDPDRIDETWFARTKDWYDRKEQGLVEGQPVSFHWWAVEGERFIGEFQLRTEFPERVMRDIGSVGLAVRVSEWGKGYGTALLRLGLEKAREHGMERVLYTVSEGNAASIRLCEKAGGELMDVIDAHNGAEGDHRMRRYWIRL
ncbi:MAG: GNAT family N-acetyltransferase [Clostridia bacterium]|nr:GNAT family N-acetyltransferase [Clostridia bacterium]